MSLTGLESRCNLTQPSCLKQIICLTSIGLIILGLSIDIVQAGKRHAAMRPLFYEVKPNEPNTTQVPNGGVVISNATLASNVTSAPALAIIKLPTIQTTTGPQTTKPMLGGPSVPVDDPVPVVEKPFGLVPEPLPPQNKSTEAPKLAESKLKEPINTLPTLIEPSLDELEITRDEAMGKKVLYPTVVRDGMKVYRDMNPPKYNSKLAEEIGKFYNYRLAAALGHRPQSRGNFDDFN